MRLVIIGAGFAGMYAALSAARLRDIKGVSPEELEIALVAPEPTLVVRPRLYESKPETLTAPLLDVLKAIDVVYVQGSAETVDTKSRAVEIVTAKGARQKLSYDRLVVATGSRLFRPNIPGLAEHGFSVDQLDDAIALDRHLQGLADRPAMNGRDTVVVAGGGFTGIEAATEMPARLRASSLSIGTVRSLPIWVPVLAPSSRMRYASSVWRPGSVPASHRSTNPAPRSPPANASKPRP
jgi:NADH dehydrogenase